MIRLVSIRHLAVIEALDLELGPGLTVLTGETGAGKSVLVEGIGLLLGGRASADMVRTGAATAQVQALISTSPTEELIVRREVSAEGRSRAFINDTLVTAGALRECVSRWVDLHGQHEHHTLLQPQMHLEYLDRVAGLTPLRAEVAACFAALEDARAACEATQLDERERSARLDLVTFQLAEIDRLGPQPGEDDQLIALRQVLGNADRLQRLSQDAYGDLYESDGAALERLALVWRRLEDLARLDPAFEPHAGAGETIKAHLEDLAFFLRDYLAHLDASPERLQQVEDRLAGLERLKRKYGPTLDEVVGRRTALAHQLEALQHTDDQLEALLAAREARAATYLAQAHRLSAARAAAAPVLCARLRRELSDLAMAHADVSLRLTPASDPDQWAAHGVDVGEFYLSANPGEAARALTRVASGGELSRVMLALTVSDTPSHAYRTLIFDEVDAGIGGRVADAVGGRLRALSGADQVLCVTHLAQVAAHADAHVHIAKEVVDGRTRTTASRLDHHARVEELARMMAGDTSAPLLEGARELLREKAKGEREAKGESESPAPDTGESPSRKGRTRGPKVSG
jgi:DNA repair protein RecN (Recombination protein N)